jgi:hypothetical protein
VASSSSSSSGGLAPFHVIDGYGAVYTCYPETSTADLDFRIWGPSNGVFSGLAAWGDDGIASVFCALKKNTDGSSWLLYRDGNGGRIVDLWVENDPGWYGLCPWPGLNTTMLAHTRTGLSLIDTSGGRVTSTEIGTGKRIYHMATISGNNYYAWFYCYLDYREAGSKISTILVRRDPLAYFNETLVVESPAHGTCAMVSTGSDFATINGDSNGGINIVTYPEDGLVINDRIPLNIRGASYPVSSGDSLPNEPYSVIEVTTTVYSQDGSPSDLPSQSPVFFSATVPGGTSPVTVVRLKVNGAKNISNLRLGLVGTDMMDGATFLVGSSETFDPVTVPSGYFSGVNTEDDPDSPFNVSIPVAAEGADGRRRESDWVSLAIIMPPQAVGIYQCRFKWYFDYESDPAAGKPDNSSSSSSTSSSSSGSSESSGQA